MEATELPATVKELPRLAGKSWWLTKQVQTFSPEEMRDLEFESAVPFLAEKLHEPDSQGPAYSLAQFGARAIPVILAGLTNSDPAQRSLALSIPAEGLAAGESAVRVFGVFSAEQDALVEWLRSTRSAPWPWRPRASTG